MFGILFENHSMLEAYKLPYVPIPFDLEVVGGAWASQAMMDRMRIGIAMAESVVKEVETQSGFL